MKGRDLEVVSDPADSLLVYDGRTGQFVVALTGQRPGGGKMTGVEGALPVVKETWGQWSAEHPETKVLALAGGGPSAPVLPRGPAAASPAGKRLVTLIGADSPFAIPTDEIGGAPLNTTAGGTPILLFRDKATGRVRAFDRHIDQDLVPVFTPARAGDSKHRNAFMVDSDANCGWSATGVAVDGDKALKGKRLKPVEVRQNVYFGPASFWYPKLAMYGGDAALAAAATRPSNSEGRAEAHGAHDAPAGSRLENGKPAAGHAGQGNHPTPPRARRPRPKKT